jgi:nonsense-mediated mRNA decay protein 3
MTDLMCTKCGEKSSETAFIDAFCVNCYAPKITCPTKIVLEQCKPCGKIRIGGEWKVGNDKLISEYVVGRCKGEFSEGTFDFEKQEIIFTIEKNGIEKQVTVPIIVEIKNTMCMNCSRIAGGYFEGIIQLRGNPNKIEKIAERLTDLHIQGRGKGRRA